VGAVNLSLAEFVLIGSNAAALVWGAATVRAEMRMLRKDLDEVKDDLKEGITVLNKTLVDHAERLARLEGGK
jgi:hypothetical protein